MKIPQHLINLVLALKEHEESGSKQNVIRYIKKQRLYRRKLFAFCYKTLKSAKSAKTKSLLQTFVSKIKKPKTPDKTPDKLFWETYQLWKWTLVTSEKFEYPNILKPSNAPTPTKEKIYAIAYLSKSTTNFCSAFYYAIIELQAAIKRPIVFNLKLAYLDLIILKIDKADLMALQKTAQLSPSLQSVCLLKINEIPLRNTQWHGINKNGEKYINQQKKIANYIRKILNKLITPNYVHYYSQYKQLHIDERIFNDVTPDEAKTIAEIAELPLVTFK